MEADPGFQYHYAAAAAPWIVAREEGGVVHLLFEFPPRILRYDMVSEGWLDFIPLSAVPSAMAVNAAGIYVAFGTQIERLDLDGSDETFLYSAPFSVKEMLVDGLPLFLSSNDLLVSIDSTTGALIDSKDYSRSMRGLSLAPTTNRIYARNTGVSPSDIVVVSYDSLGVLSTQSDSPFHGDYPGAEKTWAFPDDSLVADNSGVLYSGSLGYGGSLAGPFEELAFHASGPIVLRGSELFAHDWDLLETGRVSLSEPVRSVFVSGDSIYGFFSSEEGAGVVEVATALLVPLVPGSAVDPNGLAYAPDQILVDAAGVVYLLSRQHLSVFRWSWADHAYLPTIPLVEQPQGIAYSSVNGRLYLDYLSGKVTEIDVTGPEATSVFPENPVLNSPQQPCGLATAGAWIFVCDPSGAQVSHFTYSAQGTLISQVESNSFSLEFVWSETNGRMYYLRDGVSPNDIMWELIDQTTGTIGTRMDSPLHSSTGMTHPVRVHPDGFIVLLGSGRYHNAITLALLADIGSTFVDAQWLDNRLATLHQTAGGGSELRFWNDYLTVVVETISLPGAPLRLLRYQAELIAVTSVDGMPAFTLYTNEIFGDGFESGDFSAWSRFSLDDGM